VLRYIDLMIERSIEHNANGYTGCLNKTHARYRWPWKPPCVLDDGRVKGDIVG
jgi:hypothetical protein